MISTMKSSSSRAHRQRRKPVVVTGHTHTESVTTTGETAMTDELDDDEENQMESLPTPIHASEEPDLSKVKVSPAPSPTAAVSASTSRSPPARAGGRREGAPQEGRQTSIQVGSIRFDVLPACTPYLLCWQSQRLEAHQSIHGQAAGSSCSLSTSSRVAWHEVG